MDGSTTRSSAGVLDALVMVSRHQGIDTTVDAIRRRFAVPEGPIDTELLIALWPVNSAYARGRCR